MSLVGVLSLIHGEPGTLFDVTEPLDSERDRTGLSRIEVKVWELTDSRCLQFSIIYIHFIPLEFLSNLKLNFQCIL